MIDKKDIKIGQIVYKEEFWTQRIFSGKVTCINDKGVQLEGLFFVKPDGSNVEDGRYYGSTGGTFENIYTTAKEAYDTQKPNQN